MGERYASGLSEKVICYLFEPIDEGAERSFHYMLDVNKAYVSMLISEGIVDLETGKEIMRSLKEIHNEGNEQFEIDHRLENLCFYIEQKLVDKVGREVAEQLHKGRNRNDLYATVTRMNSREGIKRLCALLLKLRGALLELADYHCHMVFTAYTHMQPAVPITLGHYFSAILHAMERDFTRLGRALQQTNLSPLGSDAMAGTAFPIKWKKTAELLGFAESMTNSLDGIASRDYMLEALSAMNILMNHINRLCHDLHIWSTDEYGIVTVGESATASSGRTLHKKNLVTLERIKAKSSHVLAALVSAIGCMSNIPYAHCQDLAGESTKLFWDSLHEVGTALELLLETIQTIDFKEKKMQSESSRNFSTVTELAGLLVREAGISFRQAHQIIGSMVNNMLQQNRTFHQLDSRFIEQSSIDVLGKGIFISQEKIENVLRSVKNVNAKMVQEETDFMEVKKQLEKLNHKIQQDKKWMLQFEETIGRFKKELESYM
ncbi:argininosuccinate lyase [Siminovitchia sp. FSL H7-0308]|uniref:Argininosuccinate lyase n=1 Tax=Siminovitchia thermophila TaxID=1245522 RepID=A0ABS2R5W8_9BACI|nr:argininosuccinate lyase [Siminovitchia thermophila]MBM7715004.1 argininosuccinate lyase [Siminovitchia thermophila]ONK22371.1 argininosuccinate lyase [Bacillus sp. VT-16-64]